MVALTEEILELKKKKNIYSYPVSPIYKLSTRSLSTKTAPHPFSGSHVHFLSFGFCKKTGLMKNEVITYFNWSVVFIQCAHILTLSHTC